MVIILSIASIRFTVHSHYLSCVQTFHSDCSTQCLTEKLMCGGGSPNCAQKAVVFLDSAECWRVSSRLGCSPSVSFGIFMRMRANSMKTSGSMSCVMTATQYLRELQSHFRNMAQNCWSQRIGPVCLTTAAVQERNLHSRLTKYIGQYFSILLWHTIRY